MPNEALTPIHFAIEQAVSQTLPRYSTLADKDMEWIYDEYRKYFQALRQGKDPAEPSSTRKDRMAMMDAIWDALLEFEDAGGPEAILAEGVSTGTRMVNTAEELYIIALRDLRLSCRTRRQMDGPRGYVRFVQEFIDGI